MARFVPTNWRGFGLTGPKGAIRCGERSLETYCAAVVLSLLANLYLIKVSDGIAAQFVGSAAGIAALTLFATSITWISKRSRQHPKLLQRKAGRIAQSPMFWAQDPFRATANLAGGSPGSFANRLRILKISE